MDTHTKKQSGIPRTPPERVAHYELRQLYDDYRNGINALDWADTPEAVDRAILGMAFTNWAIRNLRRTQGIRKEGQ